MRTLLSFLFFVAATVLPAAAFAADDTFSCLTQMTGPTTIYSGDKGYGNVSIRGVLPAGSRFDARTATWKNQTTPTLKNPDQYMIILGDRDHPSPPICWAGGRIIGTAPAGTTWSDFKHAVGGSGGQPIFIGSNGGIIDGLREDNVGEDGAAMLGNNYIIRNTWMSHIGDDCYENDRLNTGLQEDSLFDGCYQGLSIDPGAPYINGGGRSHQNTDTVTLNAMLVRTEKADMTGADYDEYGTWFKTKTVSPSLKIYNTLLATDGFPKDSGAAGRLKLAWDRTTDCKNNTIAWMSDKPLPSNFPMPPSCFTIVKGQAARDLWNNAKQNWIDCHPLVAHIPGDPEAHPSNCNPNAYGGGGSSIPSGSGGTSGGAGGSPTPGSCLVFPSGAAPATGYGVSWDVFDTAKTLLVQANCPLSGNSLTITVGKGTTAQYIWGTSYYYNAAATPPAWVSVALSGTAGGEGWFTGTATKNITAPFAPSESNPLYFVGYVCTNRSGVWKCGCTNSVCAKNYWQLQGIKR